MNRLGKRRCRCQMAFRLERLEADELRTIVLQRVKRVSNRALRATTASSGPLSPFKRRRLNRMYQFVRSSMVRSRRGTTV